MIRVYTRLRFRFGTQHAHPGHQGPLLGIRQRKLRHWRTQDHPPTARPMADRIGNSLLPVKRAQTATGLP
jgi:hypothetical protein